MTEPCVADILCRGRRGDDPAEATTTPLCEACITAGQRAAGQLVLDYRELADQLPRYPTQAGDGQPTGSSTGLPVPIRLDVEALQRTIWWVTTTWAEVVADREQLTGLSKRTRDAWAVAWACRMLSPRIPTLARVPVQQLADYPLADLDAAIRHRSLVLADVTGARGVLDLIWLHNRARSWLGLTERIKHLPGRCQQRWCGRDELRQTEGTDDVWCDHCGHSIPYSHYEAYGNAFLQGAA